MPLPSAAQCGDVVCDKFSPSGGVSCSIVIRDPRVGTADCTVFGRGSCFNAVNQGCTGTLDTIVCRANRPPSYVNNTNITGAYCRFSLRGSSVFGNYSYCELDPMGTSVSCNATLPDGLPFELVFGDGFEAGDTTRWVNGSKNLTLQTGEGYDFSAETTGAEVHGDFYFLHQAGESRFWADNNDQQGLVDLGQLSGALQEVAIPADGYDRMGVPVSVGHVYVAKAATSEPDAYIVLRVTAVSSSETTFDWIYKNPGCVVEVSFPSGGVTWDQHSSLTIQWSTAGDACGANVRLELYQGSSLFHTIAGSTYDDGAFTWQVSQGPGEDFRVRVTDTSNGSFWGESEGSFTIANQSCGVILWSPSGGETWTAGESRWITWHDLGGSCGTNVGIWLENAVDTVQEIATSTSYTGYFLWAIPSETVPGDEYRIRVKDLDNHSEATSGFFSILAPVSNYVGAVLESGPVLYWSFEEDGADPAQERITLLPANALEAQQGATREPGLLGLGKAASFNGTSDSGQTQPRFYANSLSIGGPTVFNHYAIEMWVKLNTGTGIQYLFEGSDGVNNNAPALIHGFMSNSGVPALEYYTPLGRTGETGPTTLNDNQWHHLVVEADVVADTHTIYIDGAQSVQAPSAAAWRLPYLGVGATAYWDGFHGVDGLIDELAIYDLSGGSVTAADIAGHYFALVQ